MYLFPKSYLLFFLNPTYSTCKKTIDTFFSLIILLTREGHKRSSYTHIDELDMDIFETRRKEHTLIKWIWIGIWNVARLKVPCLWFAHRVDRVLGFFSRRPNWDSPTPSPAGENVSPPLVPGGDTLSCGRGRGGGVPIRTRRQTLWYSRYIHMYFVGSLMCIWSQIHESTVHSLLTDWVSLIWYYTLSAVCFCV